MFRLRDVQAIRRPSKRNQGSVYQEMASDASNIVDGEAQWIRRSDDLAALSPDADHGWFNVWLEDVLNKFSRETLLVSPSPSQFSLQREVGGKYLLISKSPPLLIVTGCHSRLPATASS